MADLRHAGMHWPNGPERFEKLMALPSPILLMTSPEARWHYDNARNRGKHVIWRDVPGPGNRPAELGYDARRAADAAMVLWNEQPHWGQEEFQSHCELTLNYERGDNDDDHDNLDHRHEVLAGFLSRLEPELRRRLPSGTKLHFPPWVPDGRSYDRIDTWERAAIQYDVINIHDYRRPDDIVAGVRWHLDRFPDKEVFLSEWWNDEIGRTLELLAELAAREPRFTGATYYIAEWFNAPDWWESWRNAQNNDDIYNIFLNPPTFAPQEPVEPEQPAVEFKKPTWQPDENILNEGADDVAAEYGLPKVLFRALLIAESNRKHFDRWHRWTQEALGYIETENRDGLQDIINRCKALGTHDISFGPAHQTFRWSPEFASGEWGTDPYDLDSLLWFRAKYIEDHGHALRVAAANIAPKWKQFGPDMLETLNRYNKPSIPGSQNPNSANYKRALDIAIGEVGQPTPEPGEKDPNIRRIEAPTRHIAGNFVRRPKGVILHGSRSGVAGRDVATEARGTSGWCQNNPDGLGWNATVGNDEYYLHIPATKWGWNASGASDDYIGIEIAQAVESQGITDAQVRAIVAYLKADVFPTWPDLPLHFPTHAELERWGETGSWYGKSDVFSFGSPRSDELRNRLYAALTGPEEPEPTPEYTEEEMRELDALRQEVEGLREYKRRMGEEVVPHLTGTVAQAVVDKIVNKPVPGKKYKRDYVQLTEEMRQEANAIAQELFRHAN